MPCTNLDRLDRRYLNRYGISMVSNLRELEEKGIGSFLRNQETTYGCRNCGDVISVHDERCYSCGKVTKRKEPRQDGDP